MGTLCLYDLLLQHRDGLLIDVLGAGIAAVVDRRDPDFKDLVSRNGDLDRQYAVVVINCGAIWVNRGGGARPAYSQGR